MQKNVVQEREFRDNLQSPSMTKSENGGNRDGSILCNELQMVLNLKLRWREVSYPPPSLLTLFQFHLTSHYFCLFLREGRKRKSMSVDSGAESSHRFRQERNLKRGRGNRD